MGTGFERELSVITYPEGSVAAFLRPDAALQLELFPPLRRHIEARLKSQQAP